MKTLWIIIGVIVLIAIIYWLYKRSQTTAVVIVPVSPRHVANTAPLAVTYAKLPMTTVITSSGGKNVGSTSSQSRILKTTNVKSNAQPNKL